MPEANAVRGLFSSIAGRYDLANHFLSGGIDWYWRRRVVAEVRRTNPKLVVDLATGSGDLAFALSSALGPETRVLGLDFCQPMLDQAMVKRQRRKWSYDLSFEWGDCLDLPLADDSADAVTIAFGLRNLADRDKGLREMHRILRKGTGRLVVLEFTQPERWFRPFYYLYVKSLLPTMAAMLTGRKDAYEYLAGSIEAFPDRPQITAEIEAAGFSAVQARGLTASIVAIHEARP